MSPTFDVQNPATGAHVQSVPNAGAAEARVMARKAIDAFPGWRDRHGLRALRRSCAKWFNLIIQDEDTAGRA